MSRIPPRRAHPSTVILFSLLAVIAALAVLIRSPYGQVAEEADPTATPDTGTAQDSAAPVGATVPTAPASSAAPTPADTATTPGVDTATTPAADTSTAPAAETAPSAAVTSDSSVQSRVVPSLDERLAAALPQTAGNVSVGVLDIATGVSATSGGDRSYATASIVKVDILATLLLQAQQDRRTLSASERQTAEAMVEESDNDAADTLWDEIGGAHALATANAALGLTSTVPGADGLWGLTSTTVGDQLALLHDVIAEDSPLNASSRAYLQDLMGSVDADQAWGVSAAADGGDTVLKNGWLPRDETGLWVINSIGRISFQGHELLVVVLSDGQRSEEAGEAQVEAVAKAAVPAVVSAAA
ncbi:serine hydrolase [Yinghuangia seranimata]|uniref:serine hydrolase n=1 Tax=Yinghuangia seranimata TaxID=408067 RepID=UPI00248D2DD6|nr:serine hydrolase [Yinghuangia seranimata]MDI2132335.1 serine hydrolase [Yinghuangia seranimata]